MSKKSRRLRTPNLPPEAYTMPKAAPRRAPGATTVSEKLANGAAAATVPAKGVDWQHEYGAVLSDLKRTGILAGILLVVMIVLSFIIP